MQTGEGACGGGRKEKLGGWGGSERQCCGVAAMKLHQIGSSPARVWYTSCETCRIFQSGKCHLISVAKTLKISQRRLIKPHVQPF